MRTDTLVSPRRPRHDRFLLCRARPRRPVPKSLWRQVSGSEVTPKVAGHQVIACARQPLRTRTRLWPDARAADRFKDGARRHLPLLQAPTPAVPGQFYRTLRGRLPRESPCASTCAAAAAAAAWPTSTSRRVKRPRTPRRFASLAPQRIRRERQSRPLPPCAAQRRGWRRSASDGGTRGHVP